MSRLAELGRAPLLRLPRRRHQRHDLGALHRAGERARSSRPGTRRPPASWPSGTPSTPAAAGRARWSPGARRHPPAQRPVRRQARPPAGGRPRRAHRVHRAGGGYQQEIDLLALFEDVARSSSRPQLDHPSRCRPGRPGVPHGAGPAHRHRPDPAAGRAGRAGRPGPAARARLLPDQQRAERPPTVPPEADCAAAAEVLAAGERVAMLVGQGALGAADEVARARRPARRRGGHRAARLAASDHRGRGSPA